MSPEDYKERSQALRTQFVATGDVRYLNQAVEFAKQAVVLKDESAPESLQQQRPFLHNLGFMITTRYEHTCSPDHFKEVMDIAPKCGLEIVAMLGNICHRLRLSFESNGEEKYLIEAVRVGALGAKAAKEAPESNPYCAGTFSNLALAYKVCFHQGGKSEHLDLALKMSQAAAQAGIHLEGYPLILCNTSSMFVTRFKITTDPGDLEEAIQIMQKALDIMPMKQAGFLRNLSVMLRYKFEETGNMKYLEDAIRAADESVRTSGQAAELDSERAGELSVFANGLERRYEWTENLLDLKEAIELAEEAVHLMPKDHVDQPELLSQLGSKYQRLSSRTGNNQGLETTINKLREAISKAPLSHLHRPSWLSNLSNMIETLYQRSRMKEQLDESIDVAREVLDFVTGIDHAEFDSITHISSGLAVKLSIRFQNYHQPEDFEEAAARTREAISRIRPDHPDYAIGTNNLGCLLNLSSEVAHQDEALDWLLRTWRCQNALPFPRLTSALAALDRLIERKRWTEARLLAEEAIDFMPVLTHRSLEMSDQQGVIARFSGLASDSCGLILQDINDAERALEWLEKGRGSIIGLLIDNRSDVSSLASSFPELAEKYQKLQVEVNIPMVEESDTVQRRVRLRRRGEAHRQLESCIQEIREKPLYARFLLGETAEEMKELAKDGPVVIVNVTHFRSDALIIFPSKVTAIPLAKLTPSKCIRWMKGDLTKATKSRKERGGNNKKFRKVLQELWSCCVEAIINEVQREGVSVKDDGLPHIWWIGVGIAASLPFHAAGVHTSTSTDNTLSHVISSYTPTIKALAYSRERSVVARTTSEHQPQLLLVTMPTTPGEDPLFSVEAEIAAIDDAVQDIFQVERLSLPRARAVLDRLPHCDIAHFACHGIVNTITPSASHLIFQKEEAHHEEEESTKGPRMLRKDPLTVSQISESVLQRGSIAYLSACSTAQSKTENLADEVIHLTSGFLVAGFGHVIGCAWPAEDDICAKVAGSFYQHLEGLKADDRTGIIATALHASMLEVRRGTQSSPISWAPYVHFGA